MIVHVKCIAHAFDSAEAIQYWPGIEYDLDLANKGQRKLVWLTTERGRWIFEFDRANSSDPSINMYFCKECGNPYELLSELGTHNRQAHNKNKAAAALAKKEADDEAADEALFDLISAQPIPVDTEPDKMKPTVKEEQMSKLQAAIKEQQEKRKSVAAQ